MFLDHFGLSNLNNLPNKDELKASGFLEKKSAIATISDLAKDEKFITGIDENDDDENIDDFISENK